MNWHEFITYFTAIFCSFMWALTFYWTNKYGMFVISEPSKIILIGELVIAGLLCAISFISFMEKQFGGKE